MSVPLILGVFVAPAAAYLAPDAYYAIVDWKLPAALFFGVVGIVAVPIARARGLGPGAK